jgi:hypothetical protein
MAGFKGQNITGDVSGILRQAQGLVSAQAIARQDLGTENVIHNIIAFEDHCIAIAALMSKKKAQMVKDTSDECCPESNIGAEMPTNEGIGETLIGSGYLSKSAVTDEYTGSIGYGMSGFSGWGMKRSSHMLRNVYEVGYRRDYAIYVHEGLTNPLHTGPITYNKPGSGSHFLSNAFALVATKFPKDLEKEIRLAIANVARANAPTTAPVTRALIQPTSFAPKLPMRKR